MFPKTTLTRRQMFGVASGLAAASAVRAARVETPALAAAQNFSLELTFEGAYAYVFQKNGYVTVGSIASAPCDVFDHPMLLILGPGAAADPMSPVAPQQQDGFTYWPLSGNAEFTGGVSTGIVSKAHHTPDHQIANPFTPAKFEEEPAWADFSWVPDMGKAATDWLSKLSRSLALPSGELSPLRPENVYGRRGRWRFPTTDFRRAFTDRLMLTAAGTGARLELKTSSGAIWISPTSGTVSLTIRAQTIRPNQCFKKGTALPHFKMLYEIVETPPACGSRLVPTFETVSGRTYPSCTNLTPGDLCPPGMYEE